MEKKRKQELGVPDRDIVLQSKCNPQKEKRGRGHRQTEREYVTVDRRLKLKNQKPPEFYDNSKMYFKAITPARPK